MARVGLAGKHVNLVLTEYEARMLWRGAGEALERADVVEAIFPEGRDRAACMRAYDALERGWVLADRKRHAEQVAAADTYED